MNLRLIHIDEPQIVFGHNQETWDPRDGLTLFGPLDELKPYGITCGVVGTAVGIRKFEQWLEEIQSITRNEKSETSRPSFPGFENVFGLKWLPSRLVKRTIDPQVLNVHLFHEDSHYRVFGTVDVFAWEIIDTIKNEDVKCDIWFVIIPDEVYVYCRPKSSLPIGRVSSSRRTSQSSAKEFVNAPSLFKEIEDEVAPYRYDVDFRNQLKAKLLPYTVPTQIVRESTLKPEDYLNNFNRPIRQIGKLKAEVAWNLSTATFYKVGGRPWKLFSVREGVCYVGLAYKVDLKSRESRNACCAAQMFLDSGDGIVFKGAVGPWYNAKKGEFHLKRQPARELLTLAIETYRRQHGRPPLEFFIHARSKFNTEEWEGFSEAVPDETALVGVTIKPVNTLKLYSDGNYPVLRGTAYIQADRSAYLWTKGFVPRLQTSLSLEVPNPLYVEVSRGTANIKTVMKDILALTKLNYNACIFGDGLPVTLRFADAVGEILTAGPIESPPPLAFRYYI